MGNHRKILGVIGGLGPMATAYFLQLLTQMSDAGTDQEHMEVLVHVKPQIPDRTEFILGKSSENPLPQMIEVGKGLVGQGAGEVAVPCITAHFFREKLEREIGIPVIDAIEETACYLQSFGIRRVGIMATDGTVRTGLFQESLAKHGMEAVVPDEKGQAKVMHLIYQNVKAGVAPEFPLLEEVSGQLKRKGAQAVLLACTELSILKRDFTLGAGYLDVLEVMARRAVLDCGKLRREYECLITGGNAP